MHEENTRFVLSPAHRPTRHREFDKQLAAEALLGRDKSRPALSAAGWLVGTTGQGLMSCRISGENLPPSITTAAPGPAAAPSPKALLLFFCLPSPLLYPKADTFISARLRSLRRDPFGVSGAGGRGRGGGGELGSYGGQQEETTSIPIDWAAASSSSDRPSPSYSAME